MSAFFILGLLGLGLSLSFLSDGDQGSDPEPEPDDADITEGDGAVETPLPPTAPDTDSVPPDDSVPDAVVETDGTLIGTAGDDVIFATEESPAVEGGAGDDSLVSFVDGVTASLDGGTGQDALFVDALVGDSGASQSTQILTGGAGTDSFSIALDVTSSSAQGAEEPRVTVIDFIPGQEQLEITISTFSGSTYQFSEITQDVAEDENFTDLNFIFTAEDSDDLIETVRIEGVAGLEDDQFAISDGRELIEGTDANDTLRSTDVDLGGRGEDTLSGLGGDDLLTQEPVDDAGPIVLEGGAGNDTIIASEVEFSNPTTLNGGTGDDLLITELFTSSGFETVDTFITGEGADTVAISSAFPDLSGENDFVIVARVIDFTPGEDIILIDTAPISSGTNTILTQDVTLTPDTDGGFTDVRYTVANTDNGASVSGTLRLEGVSGLSEDDLGFTLADLERGRTTSAVIGGTAADDIISA